MKNEVDMHVGRRIRHRRWLLGMTQKELADQVGVKFQQIQKYEIGVNRVSASKLWMIAETQMVPIAFYFEGLQPSENADASPEVIDLGDFFKRQGSAPVDCNVPEASTSKQKQLGLAGQSHFKWRIAPLLTGFFGRSSNYGSQLTFCLSLCFHHVYQAFCALTGDGHIVGLEKRAQIVEDVDCPFWIVVSHFFHP